MDAEKLIEQFEQKLKTHDWYYMMSDSMKVFEKGENNDKELRRLANESGQEFIDLYNKYQNR